MTNFEREVLKKVIKHLDISKTDVANLEFVTSIGYSSEKVKEIQEIVLAKNYYLLRDLEEDLEKSSDDLIFIYKVNLVNNKTYFFVFIDPFELNDSMRIEFFFEI